MMSSEGSKWSEGKTINRKQTALRDWPILRSGLGLSYQVSIDTPALAFRWKSNSRLSNLHDFGGLTTRQKIETYNRFSNGL